MIVSWLFSERKEKKIANRSTPCILVQNLGVSWKRTHSSSFLLSLSPDAGERWLGCGGFGLLPSLPPFKEREVRGCSRQVWEKPIRNVRERGMFVLWASRGPPFWGWRKPVQVLELRLACKSTVAEVGLVGWEGVSWRHSAERGERGRKSGSC